MINVTNGKLISLLVDDEPFDVRYGQPREHERILDFRAGVLHRRAEWVSPRHLTPTLHVPDSDPLLTPGGEPLQRWCSRWLP